MLTSLYYIRDTADESGRWHAFRWDGESLCGRWRVRDKAMLRTTATERPKGAYCTTCKQSAQRIKTLERRHANQ